MLSKLAGTRRFGVNIKNYKKFWQDKIDEENHKRIMTKYRRFENPPKIIYDKEAGTVEVQRDKAEKKTYLKSLSDYEEKMREVEKVYEAGREDVKKGETVE